jgi:hypothetical protein
MYQVFNTVTGEAIPVISEVPYELAGPLGERKQEQKRDEQGNLLYLKQVENVIVAEDGQVFGTGTFTYEETTESTYATTLTDYETGEVTFTDEQAYPPVMIDAGPLYEWHEIMPTDAELLAQAKQSKLWQIQAELDRLDKYLPRGLEDFWAATEYDVTNLPQVQQDRLARKAVLRAAYAAVEAAVSVAEVEAVIA